MIIVIFKEYLVDKYFISGSPGWTKEREIVSVISGKDENCITIQAEQIVSFYNKNIDDLESIVIKINEKKFPNYQYMIFKDINIINESELSRLNRLIDTKINIDKVQKNIMNSNYEKRIGWNKNRVYKKIHIDNDEIYELIKATVLTNEFKEMIRNQKIKVKFHPHRMNTNDLNFYDNLFGDKYNVVVGYVVFIIFQYGNIINLYLQIDEGKENIISLIYNEKVEIVPRIVKNDVKSEMKFITFDIFNKE